MRVFIDSSSLFKKYVEEQGAEEFNTLLDSVSEIIVSPITILEIHSILERRLREKTLRPADSKWIEKEFLIDYNYFGVVQWNNDLMQECIRVIRRYQLRILDGIQLSAALISNIALFITSDKRLYAAAEKELSHVQYI